MTIAQDLTNLTYFRGRVALYAILKGLDIGAGDDVATQAFTCVAVPEAIMATGARPVWIDVKAAGFNMDAADLRRKLTPRTRAIVVQHTYGIPAEMDSLLQVASEAGLSVIEDCCHTLASTYMGKTAGSFGAASFYSYEWGKPIVAGIGGSAFVSDPKLQKSMRKAYGEYGTPGAVRLARIQLQYYAFSLFYRPLLFWPVRSLFHHLSSLKVVEGNYNPIGKGDIAEDFSLRMAPALQLRLERKLEKLDVQTRHSRWVVSEYQKRIRSAAATHPDSSEYSDTVFARYPLLAKNKTGLLLAARKANVELADWYATPVHPLTDGKLRLVHYEPGSCPNAEKRCSEIVTLPTHPAVGKRDVDRAIRFLNETTS